jgi:hypothetical protein
VPAAKLQLTDVQVANVAVATGFRGGDAVTAVAVALAESQGDAHARGDVVLQTEKWGPSIGLWQIRSLKAQRGTGGERDELVLTDPIQNGFRAHAIFLAEGWKPWSTHTSGAYLLYKARAEAAVKNKTVSDDGSVSGHSETTTEYTGPLAAAANAVTMLAHAGKWMADPHNWLRVALGVTGAGLAVGGLLIVAKPAINDVVKTATPSP